MNPGSKPQYTINMQPIGRRVQATAGSTLLEAARQAGVGLVSLCGGEGWCAGCLVRLASGQLSPPTLMEEEELTAEMLHGGYRLACQAEPLSDVRIEIPPSSLSTPQRLQLEGAGEAAEEGVILQPAVHTWDLNVDPPSLHDLRSDAARLQDALVKGKTDRNQVINKNLISVEPGRYSGGKYIGLPLLRDISEVLRRQNWLVRIVQRSEEIIAVLPPGSGIYGLAVDIGTTKLAIYLVDLESGQILDKGGAMNPQIAYGEDVMSRISYCRDHEAGRRTLQSRLVDTLNAFIREMSKRAGISRQAIVEAVMVGNTAMHHLFAGLPVAQLGMAPCVPAIASALEIGAGEVGLDIAPAGVIYLLPNIAGYVGADHVAMLLATRLLDRPGVTIGVDIGTNTEISLSANGKLYSCSAASGPAFEGAHIENGMRAAAGAIERLQIIDGKVYLFTIENQAPVGICGSGILDAVAEMRCAGVIDEKGAFQTSHPLVTPGEPLAKFILSVAEYSGHGGEIALTRKDVNEIQLAKAAIRVGIDTLIKIAGVETDQIDEFLIAGAFGSYINIASAVQIGMFPDLPLERFQQVGNAAGTGARQALISTKQREIANEISSRAVYVELTTQPDFQRNFLKAMYLS